MKNKRRELFAWFGVIITLTILVTSTKWLPATVDWLKHSKPPETEQVAPITVEEVKQQVLLEQVKQAGGSSVLIKTEKLGDDVVPLTVRHYARWTELGEVEYWVEVIR
ncbi:hypothetical protein NHG29_01770 [Aerococcaceae bacterium NML160702]|nr:hypothetical protein [Aerococcaceae bacterium NML160702]